MFLLRITLNAIIDEKVNIIIMYSHSIDWMLG